jgi:hypothetical protein
VGDLPTRAERDLFAAEALARADVPAFRAVADRHAVGDRRSVADLKGFRSRFLRLVKEMKQTGDESPAVLRARSRALAEGLGDGPRERLLGFLAAWEVYDGLLAAAGRPDHEDALRHLLARLRERTPEALRRVRFLGVDGFDDLTGLEAALLDALCDAVTAEGGEVVVALPWCPARPDLFAATRPLVERLLARGFEERACDGFRRAASPGLARLAGALFVEPSPVGGPARGDAPAAEFPDVRSLVGADPTDEVERIAREILRLRDPERTDLAGRDGRAAPIAFRDVGIVFRRLDGFGTAARRVLESFGIPARLVGTGERVASAPVVRALRGPLALLAGGPGDGDVADFDAARLLDYLRWRALGSGDPLPLEAVDAADLRWRRDGAPLDWEGFRAALSRGGDAATRRVLAALEEARRASAAARGPGAVWPALRGAADALLPLPRPGGFDPDGRPLDPEGDARVRRAAAAKARFLALAHDLEAADLRTGFRPGLDARGAVARWLDAAEEATCDPPDRRLDAVNVMDAEEARHWELNVVFVAGLVERQFPLHPSEDVLLRDADRGRLLPPSLPLLSTALPTARDAEVRERRLFLSAVTRARKRLVLTRHASADDGRAKAPSFLWDDVNGALGLLGAARLGQADPGLLRSHVPAAEAVREGDLAAALCASLGGLPSAVPEADRRLAAALALEGGPAVEGLLRRADRFRRAGADDVAPGAAARFLAAVREVSPTQATTAAACAHRHFLEYVAKVREDDVPFAGPRVDPRDVGRLVHDALRRAGDDPDAAPEDVARAALAQADLPDGAERDFVAADLVRVLRLFRAREEDSAASGYAPVGFEVAFGSAAGTPIALGEGPASFRLAGRIDRVDVKGDPAARRAIVVDYKLSRSACEGALRSTRSHADLQMALYARAVERLLGVEVVALELYGALVRHRRILCDETWAEEAAERAEGANPTEVAPHAFRALLDEAEARAATALGAVRSGTPAALARAPRDPDDCPACPYVAVCRPDVARLRALRAPSGAEAAAPAPLRLLAP